MATEIPDTPTPLDEIRRELWILKARMDRAEAKLGIHADPTSAQQQRFAGAMRGSAAPPLISTPIPQPEVAQVSPPPTPLPKATTAPTVTPPAPIPKMPTAATAGASSVAQTRPVPQKRMLIDWENLIGGKWALWVGLFSLFLAIASFLAYTWQSLPPAPPSVRMVLGILAGAALIGAGSFFRSRTQRWFSEGLAGAGLAVLYLSIWAGAQQYSLLSFGTAFTAMAMTTVLGVYLAIRFNALSLSVLATLGGFLTPLLLHGQPLSGSDAVGSQSLSLLTYVAVLNSGILAVSLFKRWNCLSWLSLIATILLVGAWAIDDYSVSDRWATFAYFTIYFLMFVGTSCFYSLARREQTTQPDLLLLFAATSVYALAGHGVLSGALGAMPSTLALALGLFFGFLCGAVNMLAPGNQTLRQSVGGLALMFLTLAVPIQFQQQGLAIGWSLEAAVLLILALRLNASLLLRAGQIVWCLSLLPLLGVLLNTEPHSTLLFFNDRALPLLVSLSATALVVIQHWKTQKVSSRDSLAPVYATYVVLGGAWLLAQETNLWFTTNKFPDALTAQAAALYSISCLTALFAVAAFAVGMKSRDVAVRFSALAVISLALVLPVWTGLAYPSSGWTPFLNLRWLAYSVVALALAAIGWMLNRDAKQFTAEEAETLGVWPTVVSLFVLLGLTIEVWFGFGRWAAPSQAPLLASGEWRAGAYFTIALLWSVYAAGMMVVAYAWRQPPLRLTALATAGLGSLLLLVASVGFASVEWGPLFNLRALAFAVTVAMLGFITTSNNRRSKESSATATTALLAICVLIWGLSQESYGVFRHFQSTLGPHWNLIALFFLTLLWNGSAMVLLSVGLRRELLPLRLASYALSTLATALLLWTALDATRLGWAPLLNARFVAFVLAAIFLSSVSVLLGKYRERLTDWEEGMRVTASSGAGALLLWGLTQEAYETCYYFRDSLGSYWTRWAQMTISLTWSVYGASLLVGGINRNYQPLRLLALALLAATVLKVFLFDLSFLDGPLRMLSLAGLGLALIFISWLYGRYARVEANS